MSDNTSLFAKIEIRKSLLSLIKKPSILDCFAGKGVMRDACYQNYLYVGIESKQQNNRALKIDNRKFLRSSDLTKYNFFDLDAYGSPWHQFLIILKRRIIKPKENIAVVLTDGLTFKMSMSDLPHGLKKYCFIPRKMKIPALNRHQSFLQKLIIKNTCNEKGINIEKALISENKRKNVTYMGLLLIK